ncbi:hypothetical protein NKR23_g6354 [Pleurostoma richardsiae]|uniref:Ribosomal protein L5 n=1 Tax=Pleurostoma richardsiae TaxID=41990 RepID=A0AA38RZ50_9PEZI|nr:hypothetical protein NKR23_g6354 [Pleurostoma richardsiae]
MASLREVSRSVRQIPLSQWARPSASFGLRRCASTEAGAGASEPLPDMEAESSLHVPPPSEELVKAYGDPKARSYQRKFELPSNRYQYHPPKFNRGRLHPIQSPPSSDPIARDFVPGPFNYPRLKQTYQTTVAPDLMTLAYKHKPPGTEEKTIGQRLRGWDDSSPYHKNRPLRGPRGNATLLPVERDITFRNVPEIKEVTLSAYVPKALKDENYLLVARAAMQAITGAVPETTLVRKNVAQWGIVKGKKSGVKVTIYGNAAYEFVDKCVNLVFPKIKDWRGIEGSTGDSAGNLGFGFTPEDVALFPEIEVNYDMYPPKMLPGCRVFIKTSAKSDRHARLLLQAIGFPFYGRLRD